MAERDALWVIMSPESELSRSTPSAGAAPRSRRRPVIGWPWPWLISFSAVTAKLTPRSTKRRSRSSERSLPCTTLTLSPTSPPPPDVPACGVLARRRPDASRRSDRIRGPGGNRAARPRASNSAGRGSPGRGSSCHRVTRTGRGAAVRPRGADANLAEGGLARTWVGLGRAMEEGGADAGFSQRRDRRVGVRGRRIVVLPVDQRREPQSI